MELQLQLEAIGDTITSALYSPMHLCLLVAATYDYFTINNGCIPIRTRTRPLWRFVDESLRIDDRESIPVRRLSYPS